MYPQTGEKKIKRGRKLAAVVFLAQSYSVRPTAITSKPGHAGGSGVRLHQLERDPKPYGIQVKSLAVLKNRKLEGEEPSGESPLPCAGTLPIAVAEEALQCESITATHT